MWTTVLRFLGLSAINARGWTVLVSLIIAGTSSVMAWSYFKGKEACHTAAMDLMLAQAEAFTTTVREAGEAATQFEIDRALRERKFGELINEIRNKYIDGGGCVFDDDALRLFNHGASKDSAEGISSD